jgi:Family of unknown function (DUF5681)
MSDQSYDVGYGKPPKTSQFKPGQSGNPKGRKKGSRGLKTDLGAELRSKVPVTENGKTRQLTKQQLVLKAMVTKAAKGDVKAAAQVLSMTMQMFGIEDERVGKSKLSAADEALLADYLASHAVPSEPPAGWPTEPVAMQTPDMEADTADERECPENNPGDHGENEFGVDEDEQDYPDDFDDEFDDDY